MDHGRGKLDFTVRFHDAQGIALGAKKSSWEPSVLVSQNMQFPISFRNHRFISLKLRFGSFRNVPAPSLPSTCYIRFPAYYVAYHLLSWPILVFGHMWHMARFFRGKPYLVVAKLHYSCEKDPMMGFSSWWEGNSPRLAGNLVPVLAPFCTSGLLQLSYGSAFLTYPAATASHQFRYGGL